VNLALAIVMLWLGCALLAVAFHPLTLESAKGAPGDVFHALQAKIAAQNSAYDTTA
jgi:hypothetical protein